MITILLLLFVGWVALGMYLLDKLLDRIGFQYAVLTWAASVLWCGIPLTIIFDWIY